MPSNVSIISSSWADVDSTVMSLSGSNDISRGGKVGFTYNDLGSWFPNPTDHDDITSWQTPRFTLENGGYIYASDTSYTIYNQNQAANTIPYGANNPDLNAIITNTDSDSQWRLRVIAKPGNTTATDSIVMITVYGLDENGYAFHEGYQLGNMLVRTYPFQYSDNFESTVSDEDIGTPEDITNFASQHTGYQAYLELPSNVNKYSQIDGYFQFNGDVNIRYIGLRIDTPTPNATYQFYKIELTPINVSVAQTPITNRIMSSSVNFKYSDTGLPVHTYFALSPNTNNIGSDYNPYGALVNVKNSQTTGNSGWAHHAFTHVYNTTNNPHFPWSLNKTNGTTPSSNTGAKNGPPMLTKTQYQGSFGIQDEDGDVTSYDNSFIVYSNFGWKKHREQLATSPSRYAYTETSAGNGVINSNPSTFIFRTGPLTFNQTNQRSETLVFYYYAYGANIGTLTVLAHPTSQEFFKHPGYSNANILDKWGTIVMTIDSTYNATQLSMEIQGEYVGYSSDNLSGNQQQTGHLTSGEWYRTEVDLSILDHDTEYYIVFHYVKPGGDSNAYKSDFCIANIRITGLGGE